MPIIKSAKKRVRVTKKATARNVKTKRSLKSAIKSFTSKQTDAGLRQAQSNLDKAVKKGVMHKNKAARKKAQLAAAAKAAGVKPTKVAKKPVRQAQGKPAAPKKPAVKKAAVKKSPAKKTTKK